MGVPSAEVLLSPWVLGLLGLVIGSFLNVVIHRLPQLLEREWLADAAGYLQDEAAIGRVLHSSPQRTAELGRQGAALAADVQALPAMSLSRPRSRCPQCGHQLAWHENIPLLGWLRLAASARPAAPASRRATPSSRR